MVYGRFDTRFRHGMENTAIASYQYRLFLLIDRRQRSFRNNSSESMLRFVLLVGRYDAITSYWRCNIVIRIAAVTIHTDETSDSAKLEVLRAYAELNGFL